jgi:anaerobic selenocysteine-containing dehydrogenase
MERRSFLRNLGLAAAVTGAATAGLAATTTSEPAEAQTPTGPTPKTPSSLSAHSKCKALRVSNGEYRAICPGCGWKGTYEPIFDIADADARRHRKSGWTGS